MALKREMRELKAGVTSYSLKSDFFKPDFNTCNRQRAIFPQGTSLNSPLLQQHGLPRRWCIWFLNEFSNASGHTNEFRNRHEYLIDHTPAYKSEKVHDDDVKGKIDDAVRLIFSKDNQASPWIFRGGYIFDNSQTQPYPGASKEWRRVFRRVLTRVNIEITNQGKPNEAEYYLNSVE